MSEEMEARIRDVLRAAGDVKTDDVALVVGLDVMRALAGEAKEHLYTGVSTNIGVVLCFYSDKLRPDEIVLERWEYT